MSSAILEYENEQWIENRKNTAYGAWLMGAGKGKRFDVFCKELGLVLKKTQSEEEKQSNRKNTFDLAAEIIEADKKAHKNG